MPARIVRTGRMGITSRMRGSGWGEAERRRRTRESLAACAGVESGDAKKSGPRKARSTGMLAEAEFSLILSPAYPAPTGVANSFSRASQYFGSRRISSMIRHALLRGGFTPCSQSRTAPTETPRNWAKIA